jgi:hypothetical protein
VYWAKFSRAEQEQSRRVIQETLRQHHADAAEGGDPQAVHPRESFTVVDVVDVVDVVAAVADVVDVAAAPEYAGAGQSV